MTDLHNLLKRIESSKSSINIIFDKLIAELNEVKPKSSDPTMIIDIKSSSNGTITYITGSDEITKTISKSELIDLCNAIQEAKNDSIISLKCASSASTTQQSLKKTKSSKTECNYHYLIKDKTKRVDLLNKGFTIYVDNKSKYYTKCRLSSESGSNNCNRHVDCSDNVDISRMTIILFENKYLISDKLKMSCKLIIDNLSGSKEEYKNDDDIIVNKLSISASSASSASAASSASSASAASSASSASAASAAVVSVVSVVASAAALLSESDDEKLSSESEDEKSTDESEDNKSSSSESEEEIETDEIHDIDGKVYYVDQNKTVIILDKDGCGEKIGRLIENKKGTIFYQSKKWIIQK